VFIYAPLLAFPSLALSLFHALVLSLAISLSITFVIILAILSFSLSYALSFSLLRYDSLSHALFSRYYRSKSCDIFVLSRTRCSRDIIVLFRMRSLRAIVLFRVRYRSLSHALSSRYRSLSYALFPILSFSNSYTRCSLTFASSFSHLCSILQCVVLIPRWRHPCHTLMSSLSHVDAILFPHVALSFSHN